MQIFETVLQFDLDIPKRRRADRSAIRAFPGEIKIGRLYCLINRDENVTNLHPAPFKYCKSSGGTRPSAT